MTSTGPAPDDWDRHWERYAGAAERNPAQLMRRRLIRSLLGVGDGPARILDIGCGHGDLIRDLRDWYPRAELCGIDTSRVGIAAAARKVPDAAFVRADLTERRPPPDRLGGWATHAVCSEVLEHIDEPGALLRNASAYLAGGCRLVVTVPGGPISAFDREIGHRRHFGRRSLRALLADAGFGVERTIGHGLPFFNVYRLVVVMRGRRLMRDVSAGGAGRSSWAADAAMVAFGRLFSLNLPVQIGGWQVAGVARLGDR